MCQAAYLMRECLGDSESSGDNTGDKNEDLAHAGQTFCHWVAPCSPSARILHQVNTLWLSLFNWWENWELEVKQFVYSHKNRKEQGGSGAHL